MQIGTGRALLSGGGVSPRSVFNADGALVADYVAGFGRAQTDVTNISAWTPYTGLIGPILQASGVNQPIVPSWDTVPKVWLPAIVGNNVSVTTVVTAGNLTINWTGDLNDWSPAAQVILASKISGNSGFDFRMLTNGVIRFRVGDSAALTNFDSTAAVPDIATNKITITIILVDNTSVTFLVNGVQLGNVVTVNKVLANAAVAFTCAGNGIAGHFYSCTVTDGASTTYYDSGTLPAELATSWVGADGNTYTIASTGATPAMCLRTPCLLGDGVNSFFSPLAFTLVQPEEIWVVGRQITWTAAGTIFDGAVANTMRLEQNISGASPQIAMLAPSGVATNSNWALLQKSVVTTVFNGASSSIQVDGNAATTGNAGASDGAGFTLLQPGAATVQRGNVLINEVIIRKAVSSAALRASIYASLKTIWGTI